MVDAVEEVIEISGNSILRNARGFVEDASIYKGFSGYSGLSGFAGLHGASGLSGYSGVQGHSGQSGQSGWSGQSGYSGWSGWPFREIYQSPTFAPYAGPWGWNGAFPPKWDFFRHANGGRGQGISINNYETSGDQGYIFWLYGPYYYHNFTHHYFAGRFYTSVADRNFVTYLPASLYSSPEWPFSGNGAVLLIRDGSHFWSQNLPTSMLTPPSYSTMTALGHSFTLTFMHPRGDIVYAHWDIWYWHAGFGSACRHPIFSMWSVGP